MRVSAVVSVAACILMAGPNRPLAHAQPAKDALKPDEARAIAKEAYVYGFPLVDNYRIQHSYFVDRAGKVGFREAVRERDDPFGDYGSGPRSRSRRKS